MICQCPAAASLSAIPKYDCVENFGQIQKIAFQRLKDSSGDPVTNFDPTTTLITLKASWTAAMALTTDGKIVVSPFIEAPTQEGGDARTFGGGNDTLGGIEYVIGSNPSVFNCVIRRCPQNVIKALKELQCEAGAGNLGVYLFSENGQIEALGPNAGAGRTGIAPIPIRSFFVGDKVHGGFDEFDHNDVQFAFEPNYSDDLVVYTPTDFNPLDL